MKQIKCKVFSEHWSSIHLNVNIFLSGAVIIHDTRLCNRINPDGWVTITIFYQDL